MTTFKRFFFLALAMLLVLPVVTNAQTTTTALVGTVLQTIQVEDDLFVQLDIDGDGLSDALLKLRATDVVFDAQGQRVPASQVAAGMTITVPTARKEARKGYYEIPEAQSANAPQAAAQTPLTGTVVQTLQVGNDLIVLLDTDGDGFGDLEIKLEPNDTVLGADGQPLALGAIQVGTQISVPFYRYDDSGVFEAKSAQEESSQFGSDDKDGDSDGDSSLDSDHDNSNDDKDSSDFGKGDDSDNSSNDDSSGSNDDSSNDNDHDKDSNDDNEDND